MVVYSCRREKLGTFTKRTRQQLSLCWGSSQQTLHFCPSLFHKSETPSQLLPQHLHVGKLGYFQTASKPFLQEMSCCVGSPYLDLPSCVGLRTTLLGTEGQGCTSVCFAALWGGEGACRADFVSPGRQPLLPWFLGLFSLPR